MCDVVVCFLGVWGRPAAGAVAVPVGANKRAVLGCATIVSVYKVVLSELFRSQ
jgi:hypothetical protein